MSRTTDTAGRAVQVLAARDVPLGGVRAMTVHRALPNKDRSFIGAWCFADHYGPNRVGAGNAGGMDVAPHPHTELQTVSWLFEGEIEHRDSNGVVGLVRPAEVNLMTAGGGIAHSEVSTAATDVLHGAQLWVALPGDRRDAPRAFEHHAPSRVDLPDGTGTALVFLGTLPGVDSSPVQTFTPLLGAQLDLAPNADVTLAVDPAYEHGVLVDLGDVTVEGVAVPVSSIGVVDVGRSALRLTAGAAGARVLLLGGEPFEEEIVMWWNFVGRSHDDIVRYREEYEAGGERFGHVDGYVGERDRIPAPAMPAVRLRPRGRLGKH